MSIKPFSRAVVFCWSKMNSYHRLTAMILFCWVATGAMDVFFFFFFQVVPSLFQTDVWGGSNGFCKDGRPQKFRRKPRSLDWLQQSHSWISSPSYRSLDHWACKDAVVTAKKMFCFQPDKAYEKIFKSFLFLFSALKKKEPRAAPPFRSVLNRFGQRIDEFYPISPQQHNSFHYYAARTRSKKFGRRCPTNSFQTREKSSKPIINLLFLGVWKGLNKTPLLDRVFFTTSKFTANCRASEPRKVGNVLYHGILSGNAITPKESKRSQKIVLFGTSWKSFDHSRVWWILNLHRSASTT